MGTDIHGVFQRRTSDGWEDVATEYQEERHYYLFSVLADVRNGFGFAGVKTYDPVEPIAERRGLPEDFAMDGEDHPVRALELMGRSSEWHRDGEPLAVWMGDHSHSWLTADEILTYAAKHADSTARHDGILSVEQYSEWDKHSTPESFCRGVSGHGIVVDPPASITDSTTHVKVIWVLPTLQDIDYFLQEVRRLKDEHGEVRFVFGFDS